MLVGCGSLPKLERLVIWIDNNGDENVVSLADGLRRGRLPSLRRLWLSNTQVGPQGATALATALTKRALPSLERLQLYDNQIGDAELAALAPALRRLPTLKSLFLGYNQIGDRGVASLLAPPTAGVLASLEFLDLTTTTRSPTRAAPRLSPLSATGRCRLSPFWAWKSTTCQTIT